MSKCEAGCKAFTGGEIRHNEYCVYYPESLSKMLDDLEDFKTMIIAACAWADECGNGDISTESINKFASLTFRTKQ